MTMHTQRTRCLCSALFLALTAACGASNDDRDSSPTGFGHGSPRPACTQTIDPNRTPYAMPSVVGSGWGAPKKLADTLNTACPEDAIEISADGTRLYFFASPMVAAPNDELLNGTTGTYVATRGSGGLGDFAAPIFFDLGRGAAGGSVDGEPCFSPDGKRVYFHSTRAANTGYRATPAVDDPLDIYVATLTDGVPGKATNLGAPVNSTALDGEHALSPDGATLWLSSNRPGGLGGTDLWTSALAPSGDSGAAPEPVGAPINSSANELQPTFARNDPDTLYFVSDRTGPASIFRSTRTGSGATASWSTPELVLTGYVGEPSLVADGSVMYFVHVLVDDDGVYGSDVWYVERD